MEYENYTFVEAVKMLADRAGIALPEMEYSKEAKAQASLKIRSWRSTALPQISFITS